jgi:CHAD domain-containing protein
MPIVTRNSPPGDALSRQFRKTLRTTIREIAKNDLTHTTPDSHSPRKRLKLLRSLLVMMRPAIGSKTSKHTDALLRRAGKLLSDRRKAEAMVETVAKLRQGKRSPRELSVIDALQTITAEQLLKSDLPIAETAKLAGVRKELRDLKRRVKTWSLPPRSSKLYVKGMYSAYRRARKRLRHGLATGRTADLHEARKSVIHHLHHMEMIETMKPSAFMLLTKQLDELRAELGEYNDYSELEAYIARARHRLAPAVVEIANRLIARRRDLLKKSMALSAARLFDEKPQAFADRIGQLWCGLAR